MDIYCTEGFRPTTVLGRWWRHHLKIMTSSSRNLTWYDVVISKLWRHHLVISHDMTSSHKLWRHQLVVSHDMTSSSQSYDVITRNLTRYDVIFSKLWRHHLVISHDMTSSHKLWRHQLVVSHDMTSSSQSYDVITRNLTRYDVIFSKLWRHHS